MIIWRPYTKLIQNILYLHMFPNLHNIPFNSLVNQKIIISIAMNLTVSRKRLGLFHLIENKDCAHNVYIIFKCKAWSYYLITNFYSCVPVSRLYYLQYIGFVAIWMVRCFCFVLFSFLFFSKLMEKTKKIAVNQKVWEQCWHWIETLRKSVIHYHI